MAWMDALKHRIRVRLRWMSLLLHKVVRFVTTDVGRLDEKSLSRWASRGIVSARVIITTVKVFAERKIDYMVTALSYQSMMSVVPFLAIAFYLTGGLGLEAKFQEFLVANIGNPRMIDLLSNAANNILTTAESGLFGLISMLSFLWILIWLMITVRDVFNNVWGVKESQNLFKRFLIGIGVIILSPFVVILFFSGSVVYSHVLDLLVPGKLMFSESLKSALSWGLFYGAGVLMLTAMYKFVPGTRVKLRHAFSGALIAGLVFTAVQFLYLETQVMVAKQSAVYGVLAALPLFMVWLNFGWTIILYGAELTYAFQNLPKEQIKNRKRIRDEQSV